MKNSAKKEKKVNEKVSSKKKAPFKFKRELIIAVVGVLLIVGIFLLIALSGGSKENKDNSSNDNSDKEQVENNNENNDNSSGNTGNIDYGVSSEDTIIKVYGMSKEDALNLVKKEFLSDNFEFSVEISQDVTYIVSAKNVATNKVIKYEVNPSTKEYYEI